MISKVSLWKARGRRWCKWKDITRSGLLWLWICKISQKHDHFVHKCIQSQSKRTFVIGAEFYLDSLANHFLIRARFSQRTLIKVLTTLFAFLHNSNFAAATSTGGIGDCLTEGIIADESLIAAFLPCLFFRKVIWPFFSLTGGICFRAFSLFASQVL